jgi:hypothetical protein
MCEPSNSTTPDEGIMKRVQFAVAVALVAVCGSFAAAGTAGPKSVQQLYDALPQLPPTAPEAAKWVDKRGTIIHPALLAVRADIEAHKRAGESVLKANAVSSTARGAAMTEDLAKGMADVGIDMARMQSDPAYAQQVQARMRQMSPAELMAMSQTMNRPLTQDRRVTNEAQAMVSDSDAAKAAAEAGEAYGNTQLTRLEAHQARWAESERAVQSLNARPITVAAKKPSMEYDNIGCDAGCVAQWETYAGQMLPLLVARDTEVLVARRAVFDRERADLAAQVKKANGHLIATQYNGAASRSETNRARIVGYDTQVVGDIELLVNKMEEIVKLAAIRTNCGKQVVLVPGAVCQ